MCSTSIPCITAPEHWESSYKAAIVDDEHSAHLHALHRTESGARLDGRNSGRASGGRAPGERLRSERRTDRAAHRLLPARPFAGGPSGPPIASSSARKRIAEADLCTIRDATQNAWAVGGEVFCREIEALSRRAARAPMGRPRRERARPDNSSSLTLHFSRSVGGVRHARCEGS